MTKFVKLPPNLYYIRNKFLNVLSIENHYVLKSSFECFLTKVGNESIQSSENSGNCDTVA